MVFQNKFQTFPSHGFLWTELSVDSFSRGYINVERVGVLVQYNIVELDPDIKEHSPSDPNDAVGTPPPEVAKSSRKGERDEKGRSRPLLYEKEREKITLQPNIYRKENKQHQIENQRLSCHRFVP
jgi:hypothetical protein